MIPHKIPYLHITRVMNLYVIFALLFKLVEQKSSHGVGHPLYPLMCTNFIQLRYLPQLRSKPQASQEFGVLIDGHRHNWSTEQRKILVDGEENERQTKGSYSHFKWKHDDEPSN